MTTDPTCECGGREAHYYEHPAATQPTTRTLLLAGTLATTLALTACSQNSSGTPTPQNTGAEATTSAKASTSNTASTSPIATIDDPCTLLTADERAQLGGLNQSERRDIRGIGCSWSTSGSHRVAIVLSDKLSIQDLQDPGGTSIDLTVNGRKARKIPGNEKAATDNMCEIGLEIGPRARAHIVVTMVRGTAEEACQIADQAAQVFEPKLPKS